MTRHLFMRAAFLLSACGPAAAHAQSTLTTLYAFNPAQDGANPFFGVFAGPGGSLVGTTSSFGSPRTKSGTVYQLTPPTHGGTRWHYDVVHTFTNDAEGYGQSGLTPGPGGVLYGSTSMGGLANGRCLTPKGRDLGCGTVFQLTPTPGGGLGYTTIYQFTGGADGSGPSGGLAVDQVGAIYGDQTNANQTNGGTGGVFRLNPPATSDGVWTGATIYAFANRHDGADADATLIIANDGTVYGVSAGGGESGPAACSIFAPHGCGTVFALTPPAGGSGPYTHRRIWGFTGADGAHPVGTLAMDSQGALYGSTYLGGTGDCTTAGVMAGCGTVYRLSPPTGAQTHWTFRTLYRFANDADGSRPFGGVILAGGALYLTSNGTRPASEGAVVKLAPPANGSVPWVATPLFTFSADANGEAPTAPVTLIGGTLYGTTRGRGDGSPAQYGTVFQLTP